MRLVRFYHNGNRIALLVKVGHVHAHLIPMNSKGLKVLRVPADQELEFEYLDDTLLPAAIKSFRTFGAQVGITQEAARYLDTTDAANR